MPGVQCVICLSSDTSTDEWCALRECGHVFHTHCLEQSLEHNRRCPQCRTDYSGRKYGGGKLPYQRVFFEFSDEPLSQPLPGGGGGGGGGGADLAQLAFLQGQLRDKDRRLQTMATQLVESEDKAAQLQADLSLARSGLRDKEVRLQEKIAELAREHKQVKGLANQVANLTAQLKSETARATLLNLATDHTLTGSALGAEVHKLVQLGMKAPNDFWEKLVSERNSIIASNNNRHARERAALERQQEKLHAEVAALKRSLAAVQQGQPGSSAALADAPLYAPQQRAPAGPRHALRRFGGGAVAQGAAGASSSAAAAADDEDPLLRSYDLLDSMRAADLPAARPRQPTEQQQQQGRQQQQRQGQQQGAQQQHSQPAAGAADAQPAAGSEDEDEVVLLDESEEQWEEEADGWEEEEVCLSEEEEQPDSEAAQPQQQRPQQTAAPPFAAQQAQQAQQQQQRSQAGGSSLLGKRQGSTVPTADENCPGGGGTGAALLPLAAGPGRAALHRGPGKTFIRNTSAASLGIDRGRYISSGPDGKGGVATAYQSGKSGGGPAVRMAQRQLDLPALQQAAGAKKARSGGSSQSSMGGAEAAAAAALRRSNALPITSFFSKAASGSRQ